jgi:hypothetical protein
MVDDAVNANCFASSDCSSAARTSTGSGATSSRTTARCCLSTAGFETVNQI